MPAITIRDVPEDLLQQLKALAERNRRSLQQQLLVLLEQVRVFDRPSALDRAAAIRERLKGRRLGDLVADVRAERER
ncbi:MAG: Arc-like binding domain [Pseudomonadota bacterium]|jgi:hypothetical protein